MLTRREILANLIKVTIRRFPNAQKLFRQAPKLEILVSALFRYGLK